MCNIFGAAGVHGMGASTDLAEVNIVHRDNSAAASPTLEVLCIPLRVKMGQEDGMWDDCKYELLLSDPPLWKHFKPKTEVESMGFLPDICQAPVAQPELFLYLERDSDTVWGLAVKPSEVHGLYERMGRGYISLAHRHYAKKKKWQRRLQDPMIQKTITLV